MRMCAKVLLLVFLYNYNITEHGHCVSVNMDVALVSNESESEVIRPTSAIAFSFHPNRDLILPICVTDSDDSGVPDHPCKKR